MDFENIKVLSKRWEQLTQKARNREEIEYSQLFEIFKETHKAFSLLSDSDLVPREACQIIMLMDEFTYFATFIDENYFGDVSSGLYRINYFLKEEFFKGDYKSKFFVGETPFEIKDFLLDLDKISLDDFISFLKAENN